MTNESKAEGCTCEQAHKNMHDGWLDDPGNWHQIDCPNLQESKPKGVSESKADETWQKRYSADGRALEGESVLNALEAELVATRKALAEWQAGKHQSQIDSNEEWNKAYNKQLNRALDAEKALAEAARLLVRTVSLIPTHDWEQMLALSRDITASLPPALASTKADTEEKG